MSKALADLDKSIQSIASANHGILIKSTGDGHLCQFGTVADACRAAICIVTLPQESLPLTLRCGINAGELELRDGDVFGTAVNRAARITNLAHGGQVLLTKESASLAEGSLSSEYSLVWVGDTLLKGFYKPDSLYQLVHPSIQRDFPPMAFRKNVEPLPSYSSCFVGREEELAMIQNLVRPGNLLWVHGPVGIGKTRLVVEFLRSLGDSCTTVFVPKDSSRTLLEGLKNAMGISPSGEVEISSEDVFICFDDIDDIKAVISVQEHFPNATILVTSRQSYVSGNTIELGGLDHGKGSSRAGAHANELFLRLSGLSPSSAEEKEEVSRLIECTHGNPRLLSCVAGFACEFGIYRAKSLLEEFLRHKMNSRNFEADDFKAAIAALIDTLSTDEFELLKRLCVLGGWVPIDILVRDITCCPSYEVIHGLIKRHLLDHRKIQCESFVRVPSVIALSIEVNAVTSITNEFLLAIVLGFETWCTRFESGDQQQICEYLETCWPCLASVARLASARGTSNRGRLYSLLSRFAVHCGRQRGILEAEFSEAVSNGLACNCGYTVSRAALLWSCGEIALAEAALREDCRAAICEFPIWRASVAGLVLYEQGDYRRASLLLDSALKNYPRNIDPYSWSGLRSNQGLVYQKLGDLDLATNCLLDSLSVRNELGDDRGVATCLNNLGMIAWDLDNKDESEQLYRDALTRMERIGDKVGIGNAAFNLSESLEHKNWVEAADTCLRALEAFRQIGHLEGLAASISRYVYIHSLYNPSELPESLLNEGLKLVYKARQVGDATILLNAGAKYFKLMQDESQLHKFLGFGKWLAGELNLAWSWQDWVDDEDIQSIHEFDRRLQAGALVYRTKLVCV